MPAMTIRPILFSTEMVRAILEGRKTVTRRVVRRKELDAVLSSPARTENPDIPDRQIIECLCTAPCEVGDILWVRETWSPVAVRPKRFIYKADVARGRGEGVGLPIRWHPSIHMPREAARIFLRVTGVRAEKLQDINLDPPGPENQVVREGLHYLCDFIAVWERLIKEKERPTYGWEANPWVWVIEFERCETPEGWPE